MATANVSLPSEIIDICDYPRLRIGVLPPSGKSQVEIVDSADPATFREFLLKLKKDTLYQFNHFGDINLLNADVIVQKELARKDKIKFFSFYNNELIAYSFLTLFEKPSKKHNCILGIVIGDNWQGKGFGKKICTYMIKKAWREGFRKAWLNVYSDNTRAITLYKSVGFEVEGIFMADEVEGEEIRHIISMATFSGKKYGKKARMAIWDRAEKL